MQDGLTVLTINTHPGAMIALQNLNHTHRDLVQGQERITTGLKVASARDNGGVYAIAQGMRSELGGLRATQQSLDRAMSVIEVTLAASQAISEILIEMRQVAVALSDPSLEPPSFTALYREYETLFKQTTQITENAAFADINLLDGSTLTMAPLAGISISGVNLTSLLKDGVSTNPPAVDQNGLTNGFSGTVTGDLFGINRGDFNGTVRGSAFSIVEGNFNGTVWGHMGSAVRGDFTGDILGDFYGLIMGNFTGTIYGRNMGYIDGAVNGVLHDGAVKPPNPFEKSRSQKSTRFSKAC